FAGTNTFASTTTLTNSGTLVDTGTLVNAGTIDIATYNGFQLTPGSGYLLNQSGGLIRRVTGGTTAGRNAVVDSSFGGANTIVNLGTINNPQPGTGIFLADAGRIVNGSTSVTASTIYGGIPIYITGAGTVANYGTIESDPNGGATAVVLAQGGSVNN